MIVLIDTFNKVQISRHRTLKAAVKAQRKHADDIEQRCGAGCYLTYGYRDTTGASIDPDEILEIKMQLDDERWSK